MNMRGVNVYVERVVISVAVKRPFGRSTRLISTVGSSDRRGVTAMRPWRYPNAVMVPW